MLGVTRTVVGSDIGNIFAEEGCVYISCSRSWELLF